MNRLLHALGYSLQANRKTLEGKQHPDRDAQFNHINRRVRAFQRRRQPVVSVDTKKKELVGPFENAGREWRPRGRPEPVRVHDFPDKALGKAIPYGVYDLTHDAGWVSGGVDHDTASFAVETLRRWWRRMGCVSYPVARRLLITADGGGSTGSRNRLWKWELQRFADEMGLRVSVCHFPPGTSKWNKIEHRMFCHITENWRGRPLVSREVVVNLIGHTTTQSGLAIRSELDENSYPTGQPVTARPPGAVHLATSRGRGAGDQRPPATRASGRGARGPRRAGARFQAARRRSPCPTARLPSRRGRRAARPGRRPGRERGATSRRRRSGWRRLMPPSGRSRSSSWAYSKDGATRFRPDRDSSPGTCRRSRGLPGLRARESRRGALPTGPRDLLGQRGAQFVGVSGGAVHDIGLPLSRSRENLPLLLGQRWAR